MRNDIGIPPLQPDERNARRPRRSASSRETDAPPSEAKTEHREARITDTHLVDPAQSEHLTHPRMDPKVESAARRSDQPDVGIYDTPSTMRESGSDISLSIVILVVAVAAALAVLWMVFWK